MPVYFAATGDSEPPTTVKIGWTKRAIGKRLNALQTANHEVLRIIRVVDGDQDLERWFHARFAEQRLYRRREWFAFHPDMLSALPKPRHRYAAPVNAEDAEMIAALQELTAIYIVRRLREAEVA